MVRGHTTREIVLKGHSKGSLLFAGLYIELFKFKNVVFFKKITFHISSIISSNFLHIHIRCINTGR